MGNEHRKEGGRRINSTHLSLFELEIARHEVENVRGRNDADAMSSLGAHVGSKEWTIVLAFLPRENLEVSVRIRSMEREGQGRIYRSFLWLARR